MKIVNKTANDLRVGFPKVYKLLISLMASSDPTMCIGIHTLAGGFDWEGSKQGWGFWHYVYTGQMDKAQRLHPTLF